MRTSYVTLPSLGLLGLVLASAPLAAQTKQASFRNNWGNPTAGCGIDLLAKASYLPTTRTLWTGQPATVNTALSYIHGGGTMTLFGSTVEAAYGQISAEAMDGKFVTTPYGLGYSSKDVARTSMTVRLGGFTLPVGSASTSQNQSLDYGYDQDILHGVKVCWIDGWFPVTVEYTLGAGIGVRADASVFLSTMASSVVGSVNVRGYGDGSVAAGLPGWRAGVELRFDACRTELGIWVGARPSSLSGQVTLRVDSILLRLFVFAEALWQRIEEEIFSYAAPALVTRTYPLF